MASERIEVLGRIVEVRRADHPGVYIGTPPEIQQLMVSLPGLVGLFPVEVPTGFRGRTGELFDRARVRLIIELPEVE